MLGRVSSQKVASIERKGASWRKQRAVGGWRWGHHPSDPSHGDAGKRTSVPAGVRAAVSLQPLPYSIPGRQR